MEEISELRQVTSSPPLFFWLSAMICAAVPLALRPQPCLIVHERIDDERKVIDLDRAPGHKVARSNVPTPALVLKLGLFQKLAPDDARVADRRLVHEQRVVVQKVCDDKPAPFVIRVVADEPLLKYGGVRVGSKGGSVEGRGGGGT